MKHSILLYSLIAIIFIPLIISKTNDGSDGKYVDNEAINKYLKNGFSTKRLKANLTTKTDIEKLYEYVLDNEYMHPYDTSIKQPKNKKEAIEYLENLLKLKESFYFCIKLKETDKPIGQINFKFYRKGILTVSYWIAKPFSNKGYLSEIGTLFIEDLFMNSKKTKVLEIYTLDSNINSQKFINKLFFYLENKYNFRSEKIFQTFNKEIIKFHYLYKE